MDDSNEEQVLRLAVGGGGFLKGKTNDTRGGRGQIFRGYQAPVLVRAFIGDFFCHGKE